jgi:hypothetical protein
VEISFALLIDDVAISRVAGGTPDISDFAISADLAGVAVFAASGGSAGSPKA